ncbi:hypothetical protein V1389_17165 [Flavobacterium rakeshii]|uniref:hypothetical protein n=1 Tax=Flavobacterium rakeshii TaxID=1038845 RepID=UPI002E7AD72A|nr:hypothetical protein [Flavobacterium rakeshii]MEE1900081.1 hypothetical protein [Flavobacterium rakeshii]
MIHIFRSTSSKDVIFFLQKILNSLPKKYQYLSIQLNNEFILGIRKYKDTDENWYGLKLNSLLYKKNCSKGNFLLKKIYIDNQELKIDVSNGIIIRLACSKRSILKINSLQINTKNIERIDYEDSDLLELNNILKGKIVVKETFKINLDNHIYYVIEDLGDGNYISIDKDAKVYKMEHDPYEITLLYPSLDMYIK